MKTKEQIKLYIEGIEKQIEIAKYNQETFLETLKWVIEENE